jgi:dsRNA-specific ribonuclease
MKTLLKPVDFSTHDLPIVTRAITASGTGDDNYQRLEFFGDCILKLITTVHLMADNLTWPESFLTAKKGKIVSNGFLARATLAAGLDKFIITKRFTGAKWAPKYAGDLLAESQPLQQVERPSKLIADIIESLIGASYVVGGFEKAFECIRTLLPLEDWTAIPAATKTLYHAVSEDTTINSLGILETLIGYSFKKKILLLEALTHASYTSYAGPYANCSYERLEFLGDSVLDYIISKRAYEHEPTLSHQEMHTVRTAMVNAAFLAFTMMETKIEEETTNKISLEQESTSRLLWQFLRSNSPQLNASRDAALKQHSHARDQIFTSLQHDARFPWHLLALIDAPKFLSDIVESVLGAVFIDSQGDIATCEIFVRQLGILDCLEHILHKGVDCLHPKERLGHLAKDKSVCYTPVKDNEQIKNGDSKMYQCQVQIDGMDVGGVVEGLKKLSVETIAAWKACAILESRNDVIVDDTEQGSDEFFDAEEGDSGGVALQDY